jgi:hypothetical protein
MSESLKIVTAEDAALLKRNAARVEGHGLSGGDDPGRLVDLLEGIDGLKHEIHERMRRIEAVKQAKEILLEDAVRTEALNRKLNELGRTMATDAQGASDRVSIESYDESREGFLSASRIPAQADLALQEARQMLEQSASEHAAARQMQEALAAEIQAGRRESREVYEAASKRLDEAERSWKEAQYATVEAQRLLEQAFSELAQVRREDQGSPLQQELLAAHQSTCERAEQAAQMWEQADQAVAQSRQQLDSAMATAVQARQDQEKAAADFTSAKQDLTTAYQFAAVAAQRRLIAAEFFAKAARWSIVAGTASWIATAWFAWFALRAIVPIWGAGIATMLVVAIGLQLRKKGLLDDSMEN